MTDISFHPSLRGSQGHQSIGSGGSFWLPPKMKAENFDASLKNYSSSPKSLKSENSSSSSNLVSWTRNSASKFLSESKSSQAKAAGKNNPINPRGSTIELSSSKMENSQANVNQGIPRVIAPPFNLIMGNHVGSSMQGFPNPKLNSQFYSRVEPDLDFTKSIKDLKSKGNVSPSGTGNAFSEDTNDSLYRTTPVDPAIPHHMPNKSLTELGLLGAIKGLFADKGFHTFFKNGVARFAFTLENGSSVSVRIQQMKETYRICFICDDQKSLLSLSDKFRTSDLSLNHSEIPLQTHFFRSYKHMDNVLSQTPIQA